MSDQSQSPEPTAGETPTEVTPAAVAPESAAPAAPEPLPPAPEPLPPAPETLPPAPPPPTPDWAPASAQPGGGFSSPLQERPELAVGASFAGGLVLALILKRLAR